MAKLFISYPMPEKNIAEQLAKNLRDAGHEVFFFADWIGEVNYRRQFLEILATFDGVIAVVTERTHASANLRRELGEVSVYRDRRGSPQIIALVFGGELPPELAGVPTVGGSRDSFTELATAISAALGQAVANARVQREDRERIQGRLEQNAAKFV